LLYNLRTGKKLSKELEINIVGKNLGNKKYYYPEMTRNKKGLQLPGNIPRSFFIQIIYRPVI
ncbi:MAG: hypothetical protein GY757_23515, partial [bacterium]|nr:hypothetical protein [bacterium]